ncbi:MAG: Mrp/NBP35 family ATP-binding protein [Clostridia bacterium]|nr:Mrp/NBP35 family ATP-binding protein [Clostridia bacterium]MBN2883356.1 Mrp/NBP35 family ATP-binding protein [Clostridia bacterium]
MSENCDNNCSSCSENCNERTSEQTDFTAKLHELSTVRNVIAVMSGKGGVGKSLVTSLMAAKMRTEGYNVAVLDADITGPSIPKAFGIKEKVFGNELGLIPAKSSTGIEIMSINLLLENETDPVVWRGPLIGGTVKQFWSDVVWKDIDFMFIDMPPGTGDVSLTVFQSLKVDGIIVVTSPQELVSMIVSKAVKMANLMHIPIIGLVENMSYIECPDCGKKIELFGKSHTDEAAKSHGLDVLARMPVSTVIAEACDSGEIEKVQTDYFNELTKKLIELEESK